MNSIVFTGESIPAIFAGRKTHSRRVIKFPDHSYQPDLSWIKSIYPDGGGNWIAWSDDDPGLAEFTKRAYPNGEGFRCPYGKPGDLLWVKETWQEHGDAGACWYRAGIPNWFAGEYKGWLSFPYKLDSEFDPPADLKWKSPYFMPRWASRLSVRLLSVRAERLQDITEEGAKAEGVVAWHGTVIGTTYIPEFKLRWDAINSKRVIKRSNGQPGIYCAWGCNPWVWDLEFEWLTG